MRVQLLIPRQDKKLFLDIENKETVSSFRDRVSKLVNLEKKQFLLISLGKILNDKCSDKTPALLTSTYRIRDKTSIIVHINQFKDSVKRDKISKQAYTRRPKNKNIVLSLDVVTKPFEEFFCTQCENKADNCSECGCRRCLLKTGDPIICDQCDGYWHAQCAGLTKTPKDKYWYCPDCINTDVDKVIDKKKAITNGKTLDALVRLRDKECAIVSKNHVGKIPGIYCGQTWENLNTCADWGAHRTTSYSSRVLGGTETGAVSILLYRNARNLKTFEDKGYEFIIYGLGVITRMQVEAGSLMDKTLQRQDLSLALTCDAPLNSKRGAKAFNWRNSRPIRVCRSCMPEPTTDSFVPPQGIRYDGLYKVVEYWPEISQNPKRIVWKFKLRRDDDELAPWLVQSEKMIKDKGLRMVYEDEEKNERLVQYQIPPHIMKLIEMDQKNQRLWNEVKKLVFYSEFEFLNHLFDNIITCCSGACSKPIQRPIVTACGHICCKKCLDYSKTNTCFTCRAPISRDQLVPDEHLISILKAFSHTYGQDTEMIPCPAKNYTPPKRKNDDSSKTMAKKRVRIVIDSVF
ncbi:hypothetical protein G6F37_003948 [Rhizopus arrhizus]|nr:hypothetical protein G6F38_001235 [Rhizopus arrhizus]KAG1160479.1 hypothetical protein G6F37_003948 [Rhizopus arrhizus]